MLARSGNLRAEATDELELVEEELALARTGVEASVDLDLTLLGELDGVDAQGGTGDVAGEVLLATGVVEKDGLGGVDAEARVVTQLCPPSSRGPCSSWRSRDPVPRLTACRKLDSIDSSMAPAGIE